MIRGGRWTGWAALCSSIPGGLGGVPADLGLAATGPVCTGLAAASPPTPALRLSARPTSACGTSLAQPGLWQWPRRHRPCGSVSAYSGFAAIGPAYLGLRLPAPSAPALRLPAPPASACGYRPRLPPLAAAAPPTSACGGVFAYLGLRQRLRLLRLCGYWPRLPRLAAAAPPASPAPASFSRNPASCGISNDVFRHNKVREC